MEDEIKYKNEILFIIGSQTIIGSISDIYRLVYDYKNYLATFLKTTDILHVSCISMPIIGYTIYINNLNYIDNINYFLYALLFWFNSYIIYINNGDMTNTLNKLSIWNHILWHFFMGLFTYNLLS